MYEDFSADYDRFVDWDGRLAAEMDFLLRQLQVVSTHRVLDAACGTGMHAVALAKQGYVVTGADLSRGMVERARDNATREGVTVRFEVAGFGALAARAGSHFDAVLCLGNSLPHVLTATDLAEALDDFAACLRPGGLLVIQNRNFDAVLARRELWMAPQSHREDGAEWLFIRWYDFSAGARLTFNVMTLRRIGAGGWDQRVASTQLWPLRQAELADALRGAGFEAITSWGDMTGAPFDSAKSPNLILTAQKRR
jgi:SAM-dependent methyltransferase